MIVESYPSTGNRDVLNTFFSEYLAANEQSLTVKGPISDNVLNGVLEVTGVVSGYSDDFSFGALYTMQSQYGWITNGKRIRGAYANMVNPLSVPIRLTRFDAIARPHESVHYSVSIGALDIFNIFEWFTYQCDDDWYAFFRIGEGMWKDDPSKTYVDIEGDSKGTFFVIMSPPEQYEGSCIIFEYSCCFVAGPTALICHENPDLYADSDNQLDQAYVHLEIQGNATLLLDYRFEVNLTITQDFFPMYFGREIYAQGGELSDFMLACHDIEFL